ncbi:hypothetical protein L914_01619 [Phytophthora nicotianae]|uniref:Uncharacterized protein n=1 Tax=Phytophthora nicotianae TaxID=4792 RepID=W2P4F0_PHYNI|nr:hypothetical protein L914_01619 [Phytophthora nicotianae]
MATKRPRLDAEDDPGPNSQVKKIEDISSELSHLTTETKRRRQDVDARRAANADKDVSVIKISLKSFCTEQSKTLPWEERRMCLRTRTSSDFVISDSPLNR